MKINNITNIKNYQNQNHKHLTFKAKEVDLKFSENDMESGSIAAAIIGLAVAGMHLTKMNITKATKNFIPKTIGISLMSATVSALATMGVVTFAKIYQKNKEAKKEQQSKSFIQLLFASFCGVALTRFL